MSSNIKHAWFSEKQAEVVGTCFYIHEDGRRIQVSCVSDNRDYKTGWDDITYLGKVVRYSGPGRPNPQSTNMEWIRERRWTP